MLLQGPEKLHLGRPIRYLPYRKARESATQAHSTSQHSGRNTGADYAGFIKASHSEQVEDPRTSQVNTAISKIAFLISSPGVNLARAAVVAESKPPLACAAHIHRSRNYLHEIDPIPNLHHISLPLLPRP
jgi:hypothetical protein